LGGGAWRWPGAADCQDEVKLFLVAPAAQQFFDAVAAVVYGAIGQNDYPGQCLAQLLADGQKSGFIVVGDAEQSGFDWDHLLTGIIF
jgi:hypothetical protein